MLDEWKIGLAPSLRVTDGVDDESRHGESDGSFEALLMLEIWYHDICASLFAIVLPSARYGYHISIGLPATTIDQAPKEWVSVIRKRCIEHCTAVSGPARRANAIRPGFVFKDPDFALVAIESVWRRMASLRDDPGTALREDIVLPMAMHIERTFQLVAATRVFFPMVQPLVSSRVRPTWGL